MKKSILFIFLISISFQSCLDNFEIEDNARLYATAVITDPANNPIEGIDVTIEDEGTILGRATSNNNGIVELIALKSNAEFLDISIIDNSNGIFTGATFKSSDQFLNEFNLGTITLLRKSDLAFSINKTSNTEEILFWRLEIQSARCIVYLNGTTEDYFEEEGCYEVETITGSIATQEPVLFERVYNSILASTAVFTYRFGENGERTTVEIPLNDTINTYEFEY